MSERSDQPGQRFDAVICDVDGCLCPETAEAFDIGALAQVAAHNSAAEQRRDRPRLTLCTGRPVSFAEAMARAVGVTLPIMAENGAWVWDPQSNAHELDPAITTDHLDAVAGLTRWTMLELGPEGVTIQPGKRASVTHHHPDTEFLSGSVLDRVNERIEREFWPFRVSMTWFYINCDLAHVSKATAIERFKARTGLPTGRLAGIGDTLSDAKIADAVAWFACPANAQDAIKARADYVSENPLAEGVLDILARITPTSG